MVFRFAKTLDPITLFHTPSNPASKNAYKILQRASTQAQSPDAPAGGRGEFQLEVTTAPPTTDQLRNILDYVTGNPAGAGAPDKGSRCAVGEVVRGAKDAEEAIRRFKGDPEGTFVRPITVDWTNGQAVVGDNESEILKMVQQINEN
ncbi:uncharacterized protein BO66DRAFT_443143 [Aspergillus aculeatinus CBS 121060]|uniref:Uncharacterized protein n=2 Tax=Aspergillus subgen. Circumdati TaxID=2720871 RepID=A0ACD1GVL2_9EURO|nr:hypothetical protein BO95DRAFT_503484 [Aspergillus brunneoviolaceus CBS 621.78]XP_025499129.1 hypothetical protein BO66DRAFT_443143 [Aspergillus aculeatinus CBS 121060]RAH42882.1 hypothetical protein BO95DRAFT_503484 [Aspergillus brunneoviolaceus CBS 621.78]RAH65306.1 hypothetical protein BO66DRAFT_443143 [Aspergillus aculeatinus CBS 121060]